MALDSDEQHYLTPYLSKALPDRGLDYETYGPYVTGFADNDDDDETSFDDLIELLQASSETHGDDEASWSTFRNEVIQLREQHSEEETQKKQLQLLEAKQKEDEKIRKEIELSKKSEEEMNLKKQQQAEARKAMDPSKRALMERYAYDESEIVDENGNVISTDSLKSGEEGTENESVETNHEVASKMNKEKSQQVRSAYNQTKREEQLKTKKSQQDKLKKKEDRRKRTQRGERRR